MLVRCWVVAFLGGLWRDVVALGSARWRVVVWWLLVVWHPVPGERLPCVPCVAVALMVR